VHWFGEERAHPAQLTNECPLLPAAVNVIGPAPTVNGRVQFDVQVTVDWPGADTETVLSPVGVIKTVRMALFPVAPVKHTTFTDTVPVTIAPDDDRPPRLARCILDSIGLRGESLIQQ